MTNLWIRLGLSTTYRFKRRLVIAYFLLIVLPFMVITSLSYRSVHRSVDGLVTFSARQSFDQTAAFLSRELGYAVEISNSVMLSSGISPAFIANDDAGDLFLQMGELLALKRIVEAYSVFRDVHMIRFYVSGDRMYVDDNQYLSVDDPQDAAAIGPILRGEATAAWLRFANDGRGLNPEPTISYVRVIPDANDLAANHGLLRVDLREPTIRTILQQNAPTPGSESYLLDRSGTILSSSVQSGQSTWDEVRSGLSSISYDHGDFVAMRVAGRDVFFGLAPIVRASDLQFVSIVPVDEMLDPGRRVRRDMIVLLVLISLTALVFASMMSSSIVQGRTYELQALQGQINPHFLYNTLDMINWSAIERGVPEISSAVIALSRYYKLSLSHGAPEITVADEVEHARLYVEIQNRRLDNVLEFRADIEPDAACLPVVKTILQPLVENAILHGIVEAGRPSGVITVRARIHGDDLTVTVADDGVGMDDTKLRSVLTTESGSHGGYGVKNVNQRIRLHYGDRYGLTYDSSPGRGTTVTIRLPVRRDASTHGPDA